MWALVSILIVILATGRIHAQQTPPPSAQEQPTLDATAKELDRIRRSLESPPSTFVVRTDKPLFRVEIVGKKPTFISEITPAYFVSNITPPRGSAWHSEFLAMVAEKDLGSGQITGIMDQLQTAAVMWLAKSLIKKVSATMSARELRAIRAQIQSEIAEIEARKRERDSKPWLYIVF